MPIVNMYRDGDIAFVNTDHLPTYENFLEHGWVLDAPELAPVEAVEAPAEVPAEALTEGAPTRRGRNKSE